MAARDLYRWAGVAGLLSGLFLIVQFGGLLVTPDGSFGLGVILILAWILGLYAITGAYLIQRRESGTLGAIGYAVNLFGLALVVARASTANLVLRGLPADVRQSVLMGGLGPVLLAMGLVLLIGTLLFGWATFRAGVLPRAAAVLYMVGFLGFVLGTFLNFFGAGAPVVALGGIIAGIGMAWFGYALWSPAERQAEATAT